jgi:thymidylate kinase
MPKFCVLSRDITSCRFYIDFVVQGIKTDLQNGTTLICDRYAYSGVAFSSSKGMDLDWCINCDRGLVAPDAVIYLDMPVEETMKVSSCSDSGVASI